MKVGDRVTMAPMWKYDDATGTIIKIITDYTHEQAVKLQPIEDEK